jgi:hypothetical protein
MPTDLPRTDTDPSPAPPASHEHDDLFAALRTRARHRKRARHPLVTFAATAGTVIAFGALLIAVPIALRKPATGTYSPLVTVRERVPSSVSPAIAVPPPRTTDASEGRESTETNTAGSTDGPDEQEETSTTTVASPPPSPAGKSAASDKPRPPAASTVAAAEKSGAAPTRAGVTPAAPAPPTVPNVQPAEKLAEIRSGDSKERIFDLFATVFVKQGGKVEQIDGIRLRVSSRPAPNRLVEVSEVVVGERGSNGIPYWFLFEEGRLLAWGKPEQWEAAAIRYQIELDYAPRHTAEARSRS